MPADLLHGDLPGAAGPLETDARERVGRLAQTVGAEVVRVVVREVHHGEARLLEPARVRGRRLEGEAVRRPLAALRPASGRQRALEVPEHDVAGEVGLDVREERASAVRRQVRRRAHHDVARRDDRDDALGDLRACRLLHRRRLRLRRGRLDGGHVRSRSRRRLRPAVDEQREDERARGDDRARHARSARSPAREGVTCGCRGTSSQYASCESAASAAATYVIAAAVSTLRAPCDSPLETSPMSRDLRHRAARRVELDRQRDELEEDDDGEEDDRERHRARRSGRRARSSGGRARRCEANATAGHIAERSRNGP